MRKKRFYKNVKRNRKWTESARGRKLDFADKYADGGIYTDKFDYLRPKKKSRSERAEKYRKLRKALKIIPIALLCFAVLNAGYALMGIYMNRHAMPELSQNGSDSQTDSGMASIQLKLYAQLAQSVSLDGSVMLDAVINEAQKNGCNGVAFEIKRQDGTLGYMSTLANADAYNAVASPMPEMEKSVEQLIGRELLPAGIVWCYRDGIVPAADGELAVKNSDGSLYTDIEGNTYLNPDAPETYNYLKDIIVEAKESGITVFALCATALPDDISGGYGDGFEALAKRLYDDIGTDIKLLEGVELEVDGDDPDDLSELALNEENKDRVYLISSSADKSLIKEKLEDGGAVSCIFAEQ